MNRPNRVDPCIPYTGRQTARQTDMSQSNIVAYTTRLYDIVS